MGSDFSSISTDVVLNSSETRTVWSSESAVIVQDRWNYVEALIDLTYPSTAEIIFRGIASAEDTLRLTEISIRDFIQEMIVGAIDFVRATGGMIYVEISTAKSVPEPVLLRAYVNRLNSSKSPALSFTVTSSMLGVKRLPTCMRVVMGQEYTSTVQPNAEACVRQWKPN
ncbi:hypothetical protein PR003_g981 [Phytophthora rubi]|nr:hypothetical protein PR003_g981 [Phytophthora rubi]